MTDPLPNTDRNVSAVSSNLARETRFNGTGIVAPTGRSSGTGCLISDQWVLTARHVVAGATGGTFFVEGNTNRPIVEVHTRADSDVALVKLATPLTNYPTTPIYQGSSEVGREVWVVGYGQHGQFTGDPAELSGPLQGRYAAMNRVALVTNVGSFVGICLQFTYNTGTNALPLEGATAPGDSGGPMFMEEKGRLWVVGEIFGVLFSAPGFYMGRVSAYKDWIRTTTGINFNEANWDADPATPGIQNGSGTWGGTGSNWYFGRTNFTWADGYDVVFGAGTNNVGSVTLSGNRSVGDMTFASQAATQSLSGSGTLALKDGAAISNSTAVRIETALVGTSFKKTGAGTLTLVGAAYGGNLDLSGPVVVEESGDRTWTGRLSGSGPWSKTGSGTLTLSSSNSFSGIMTVNSGAVRVTHSSALGSATESVVVGGNATAALEFTGGITVADPLRLQMHNTAGHAQLRNLAGTNVLTGNILLDNGGTRWDIASSGGLLIFRGSVSNIATTATPGTLHLQGPAGGSFAGPMTDSPNGADKLAVNVASGDWTLGGSNKTYTGPTTVGGSAILRIRASLASPINVQSGATLATALTNWTEIAAAPEAAALTATNGTQWKVRLATAGMTNFSETPKTVPLLTVTGGMTNINPALITVEVPGFPGTGAWAAVTNGNLLSVAYTPDGYAQWMQSFAWGTNSSAPKANPDGDMLGNFAEYAFGGNPLDAGSDPVPAAGRSPDGRFLTLTFQRERADVTYAVQACDQLSPSAWTNLVVNPGSVGAEVTCTDDVAISSRSMRFLRLRLSR